MLLILRVFNDIQYWFIYLPKVIDYWHMLCSVGAVDNPIVVRIDCTLINDSQDIYTLVLLVYVLGTRVR